MRGSAGPRFGPIPARGQLIDRFDQVAPNFKASILHRQIIGPCEMEHGGVNGLPGHHAVREMRRDGVL